MTFSQKIASGSLLVSVVVLAIKYAAYHVTGSVALFSDALESIINVATALTALVAIRYAARPPDQNHPYGHQKAEYLSAVGVGALILVAGFAILREAYAGFITPRPIDAPVLGLAISGVATTLNAIWSAVLIRQGRRNRSAALVADGKHLFADVVTSAGVIVGLSLVVLTNIGMLDSVIAALVAVHVLRSGWGVIRESSGGLLDEAAPTEQLALIRKALEANAGGALEVHGLRTRHAGKTTFIDFHLVVPGEMTVARSHEICDRLKAALTEALGEAVVTIHVEPDDKAEHIGALLA
ncbi:cation diffusion facilitator family transporter [Rhodoblastus acidophilus]|uniref:Cation diffusion facilitator family transporter n=1 Tax=Candidatus Rhodoblastus alkanivorans TaxID=2954117 RepID=A0ABS9Z675_9HYPH|nr:cation diffusion facilitator family transporter [Candidatus Rhodoblastus alkanivorans]MCI4677677.1 cation diffusion facilitator family transporter [Candidatus Rhodoblastus alkanivorans]MCI4682591.1 cation diffusion facilitator family transporter [Candidatus Rhodoblastus alkanivorans]MDI4639897.1 cation diffusion facilitator family transporter [Rhodoblastus acidophilus]